MISIDLNSIKRIHFSGIGGISMSGIAEILHTKGYKVSGSDVKESEITNRLEDMGIKVIIGQVEENITDDVELVVYSAAVRLDSPELKAAENKGVKIVSRAAVIGEIMKRYEFPVCVAGTHGKTTTSSMVSEILITAEKDPTISIGGVLPSIGRNIKLGNNMKYFVLESCEYYDSFLEFYPYVGIILNMEEDHLDYFRDIEHIKESFHRFAGNIEESGLLVVNCEIDGIDKIVKELSCNIETYGKYGSDWYASNVEFQNEVSKFDVVYRGEYFATLNLKITGEHNISNAIAAIAAANFLKIPKEKIKEALENFRPPLRRFQIKGEKNGVMIIDDYAHHPTEIVATLKGCKNIEHNRLWCVFQPHTYSRTEALLEEFAQAFDNADKIIILDIYASRESDNKRVHSKNIVEILEKRGKDAYYIESFDAAQQYILEKSIHGDMLITMGAGDVYLLGERILNT